MFSIEISIKIVLPFKSIFSLIKQPHDDGTRRTLLILFQFKMWTKYYNEHLFFFGQQKKKTLFLFQFIFILTHKHRLSITFATTSRILENLLVASHHQHHIISWKQLKLITLRWRKDRSKIELKTNIRKNIVTKCHKKITNQSFI